MAEAVVIIPTYNERKNIVQVLERVFSLPTPVDVLVVDDSSPDGTGEIVRELQEEYGSSLHLMVREQKSGLGTAYLAGFTWALERNYQYILEMDADLSHDPREIPNLIDACRSEADLAIGSRYCNGVNVIKWPIRRLLLSYFANKYTRIVTGLPIKDTTAGFKCFHRKVLERIDFSRVRSSGYSFQIEMNFRAWKLGYRLVEIPIIFEERSEGQSKMSKKIIMEAIFMVWKLKFRSIFGLLQK